MPPDHERQAADAGTSGKDFARLHASGERWGASRAIGGRICAARDALATLLIRCKATPNRVTIAGFIFTCGAGYCLFRGASHQLPGLSVGGPVSWWPTGAAVFLILAGACDMLDGAIARVGKLSTRAGALLDSAIDRFSDMAIYAGCVLHFALIEPANLTYQVLAVVALCNGVMISYIKARAEDIVEDCSVGYWLRGERFAAILIGTSVGHVPAVLWQMAVSGFFTVWRRLTYGYAAIRALETGRPPPPRGPSKGWFGRVQLWRHPRGSVPYDLVTGAHVAYIVFAPWVFPALALTAFDPLRAWLA